MVSLRNDAEISLKFMFLPPQIERIQNLYLYKNYQVKKQSLETKNGRTDNERQLFHGTDENTIKSVNSNGFNRSYSGLNGEK